MSHGRKHQGRASRVTPTGAPLGSTAGRLPDKAVPFIDAAVVALGAPPHVARLCRELVTAAVTDDDSQRLGLLAGTASLDPRTAAQVIGVLAGVAAALAVR